MSKSIFDSIIDSIFDAEWTGKRGEKLTEKELNLVKFFGRDGKTLRNVYIPKSNGETSEIDVLYITKKGIFVFESKNYSGWIFGDEKSQYWTAMLPNKLKNKFYNPIKQNKTHIKWLNEYLGGDIPLFSIIVFSERCEIKKVTLESSDVKVIKRDRIYATVRSIWDDNTDVLSEEKLNSVFEQLKVLTNVDEAVKQAHIDTINNKFNKPKSDFAIGESISDAEKERLCPKCGKPLVLRTAKKGRNSGNQFYGCSGFPKCRYIENINNT